MAIIDFINGLDNGTAFMIAMLIIISVAVGFYFIFGHQRRIDKAYFPILVSDLQQAIENKNIGLVIKLGKELVHNYKTGKQTLDEFEKLLDENFGKDPLLKELRDEIYAKRVDWNSLPPRF